MIKKLFGPLIGTLLFAIALFLPDRFTVLSISFFIIAYLLIGADILVSAIKHIIKGQMFDETFLMSVATIGAISIGQFAEAVAVMLFYKIGEFFQDKAIEKSRSSIKNLMDIRPDYATLEENGVSRKISPENVPLGATILIKPGEKIPLDGIIIEGFSSLNTSALTGESLPRDVSIGEAVISGCINITGVLRVQVTSTFGDSTVMKILALVENANEGKSKASNFITKFAQVYSPIVVGCAILLAVLPPLFIGSGWSIWIHRALLFLVVSCPCALVISVPLSFFGGIGGASRRGILIKGGNYIDALAHAEVVVFDKTGTLTKGNFFVTDIHPETISEKELIEVAALAESYSDHPISASLRAAYNCVVEKGRVGSVENFAGFGIKALVDGKTVFAGNSKLMEQNQIKWRPCNKLGTIVHVAMEGIYVGHIVVSDEIKENSYDAIMDLKNAGIKKTVMLTGDQKTKGEEVASKLGIDEVYAELLPGDKVDKLVSLLNNTSAKGTLLYVGDGINDAPVLARADVGIAMGALGSDAAIEAADVVLMNDDPKMIAEAILIARKTLRIVTQNIIFALVIKVLVLLLGALGLATMWEAVFADVGVSFLAILNAMRTLKYKK